MSGFSDVYQTIYWNPSQGHQYNNGLSTSPATDFDHEADHANAFIDKTMFSHDKEEARVINGSEQKMARANGDIKSNQTTRKQHSDGKIIIVDSVTSNRKNDKKTKQYEQQVELYRYSQD